MAGQKVHSAKRKRFITNSVVHVVLGILAVIWVFPVIWVVLTSFRAEQGVLCIHLPAAVLYTG